MLMSHATRRLHLNRSPIWHALSVIVLRWTSSRDKPHRLRRNPPFIAPSLFNDRRTCCVRLLLPGTFFQRNIARRACTVFVDRRGWGVVGVEGGGGVVQPGGRGMKAGSHRRNPSSESGDARNAASGQRRSYHTSAGRRAGADGRANTQWKKVQRAFRQLNRWPAPQLTQDLWSEVCEAGESETRKEHRASRERRWTGTTQNRASRFPVYIYQAHGHTHTKQGQGSRRRLQGPRPIDSFSELYRIRNTESFCFQSTSYYCWCNTAINAALKKRRTEELRLVSQVSSFTWKNARTFTVLLLS